MTRLLLVPDDRGLALLDTSFSACELTLAINAGTWLPPEPYAGWLRGLGPLRAVSLGSLVVATPEQPTAHDEPPGAGLELSRRELEVLQGLAEGLSNKEIAFRLHLSVRTVAYYLRAIRARFGWNSRGQSVSRAAALGLVKMKRKDG